MTLLFQIKHSSRCLTIPCITIKTVQQNFQYITPKPPLSLFSRHHESENAQFQRIYLPDELTFQLSLTFEKHIKLFPSESLRTFKISKILKHVHAAVYEQNVYISNSCPFISPFTLRGCVWTQCHWPPSRAVPVLLQEPQLLLVTNTHFPLCVQRGIVKRLCRFMQKSLLLFLSGASSWPLPDSVRTPNQRESERPHDWRAGRSRLGDVQAQLMVCVEEWECESVRL